MKSLTTALLCLLLLANAFAQETKKVSAPIIKEELTLSKATLTDKIKGGWAGQTIGVTFGGQLNSDFVAP